MADYESEKNAGARLEYWLTNIFWYHYKWYWLIGVFVATFAVLTIADSIRSVTYDWRAAYIVDGDVLSESDSAQMAQLERLLSEILPERTGNNSVDVDVYPIMRGDSGSGAENALIAVLVPETYVVAASKRTLEYLSSLGRLNPLYSGQEWVERDGMTFASLFGSYEQANAEMAGAIGMKPDEIAEYNEQLKKQSAEKMGIVTRELSKLVGGG
ncbi:MAG: hypothetical protein LBC65_05890 [Oscillospiraceae bacterium]|nr:hypothetical protein [Oscillospiraceae bacterium]